MKIHIMSDLHLEFGDIDLPETDADVIVLAGDVSTGLSGMEWAETISDEFGKPVIYVAGNHEYYGQAIPHLTEKLKQKSNETKVHFLNNATAVVDGVRFIGTTLWTDFGLFAYDPVTVLRCMALAGRSMNDYRRVRKSPEFRLLQPADTQAFHRQARKFLERELSTPFDGKTVVVTHHAPHANSIHQQYKADPLSAAYASDMTTLMGNSVALWIHGHTHHSFSYDVNGTRVVCNPRGYVGALGASENTEFDVAKVIQI